VAVIEEALGHRAPQLRVSAGNQYLHCHDLLYLGPQRVMASIPTYVTGQ
jgi:hypothetical protein